jgi:hypothetical protein
MKNPDGSQKKIRALPIFDAQFLTILSYMTKRPELRATLL